MASADWKCSYCRARNPDELTRCRLCATVRPGVDFGSSPAAQTQGPSTGPTDSITYAPTPPPPPPAGSEPPPLVAPTPLGPPQSDKVGIDKVGLLVILLVVALIAGVAVFFVVGTRTDPGAAKDRDAATASLLSTADIGGQWRVVHEEQHALGGGTKSILGGAKECSAPDAAPLELEAWTARDFSVQQGAVFAYVTSAIVVASNIDEAANLFDDFRLVALPCIKGIMASAGADLKGFSSALRETDDLSVGDHSATFTGAFGAGNVSFGIDALIVQSGRSMILIVSIDTTGTTSKHFVDWATAVGDRLKKKLPAR